MNLGPSYETKVDVIPIINVSLVIVLTLMLISPFLSNTTEDVDLPEARAAEVDDEDSIEITMTLDNKLFIGEDEIAFKELRPILTAMFDGADGGVAVIKADKALLYGEVEKLIAEVEKANVPRIAIATRQKVGEES